MAETAREAVAGTATVALRSQRFGDYDIPVDRVLHFPDGLIGLPTARRFALLDSNRAESPFRCLVCLDLPELGFVVCDPIRLWPEYAADVPVPDGARAADVAVLAIVTVPQDARDMTANLMAPLVVDSTSRVGVQLVLDTGRYGTRHPLVAPAAE